MILRLVYTKTDYMKFLGHLELMRFFERAFRRLEVPLCFSEGFNPHPKMTFGGPLSVGVGSMYEVMEVEIERPINYSEFVERFNGTAPKGLAIVKFYLVGKSQSLMSALTLATYQIVLDKKPGQEDFNLEMAYAEASEIILRKKNKKFKWVDKDLKPYIKALEVLEKDETKEVYRMSIHVSPDGSAKPQQIVGLLLKHREDLDVDMVDVVRTGLFYTDGDVYKPLAEL